jgi:hypothetical protein
MFRLPFRAAKDCRRIRGLKREGPAMKLPQTGGCQCGAFRYEITDAPSLVYTCHCTDCQRLTGSAFSMGLVTTTEAFSLSGAEPRAIQRTADSGRSSTRWFCPECGTWFCSGPDPQSPSLGLRRSRRVSPDTCDGRS